MVQFESVQLSSTTEIVVTFQFEGFHYWPKAPSQHSYLSRTHRHMFHAKAWKEVSHGNREIEIIQFKRNMQRFAMEQWGYGQMTTMSCEQMAEALCKKFELSRCEVLEDGENGALFSNMVQTSVVYTPDFHRTPFEPESKPAHFPHVTPVPEPITPKRPPEGSIFLGNECEGPLIFRGRKTLFIPALKCTIQGIQRWCHIDTRDMAIYLGAGGDVIEDDDFIKNGFLRKLVADFPFLRLIIEVSDCDNIGSGSVFNTIVKPVIGKTAVVSHDYNDIKGETADYYKTVSNGYIHWLDCYGDIHTTSVDDPEFAKDAVI